MHDLLNAVPARRFADVARPFDMGLVHKPLLLGIARDHAGEMINLGYPFGRPPRVVAPNDVTAYNFELQVLLGATLVPFDRAQGTPSIRRGVVGQGWMWPRRVCPYVPGWQTPA